MNDKSTVMVKPASLLESKVPDYVPNTGLNYYGYYHRRPIFTQWTIREMLVDPRVLFGLWLIKGPILSKAKFTVESESEEVKDFVVKSINNFWQRGASQALKAIEWGYSGSEVLYERDEDNGQIIYRGLKDFESYSVKVVTNKGRRVGILVDNYTTVSMEAGKAVYVGGPKAFHHVQWRQYHPHYGRSRLVAAHIPWEETWAEGGYRDIRRLWFHKNAFEGGTMYHPNGSARLPNGTVVSYKDMAQEIIEKRRSGAVMTLPSDTDSKGNKLWEYSEAKGNTIPAGLFDYGDSLRVEILEAMGIPYEVIESSGNEGFGSSTGREIPQTAFYSILQEMMTDLICDFNEQVIKPGVQINAALGLLPYATYNILPHPLDADAEEKEYDDGMEVFDNGQGGTNEDGSPKDSSIPNANEKFEMKNKIREDKERRRKVVAN